MADTPQTCDSSHHQIQVGRDESWPKGFYRRTLEGLCVNDGRALSNLLAENTHNDSTRTRTGFIMFPISLQDVQSSDPTLVEWIVQYPADVIVYADEDLKNVITHPHTHKTKHPEHRLEIAPCEA